MVRQEAGKPQPVEIRSTERIANRRRTNLYTEAATESVKLKGGMYQAVAKASVLSSEKFNIVEVDTVMGVEDKTDTSVMARLYSLYRSRRQRHDTRWDRLELGRSVRPFCKDSRSTFKQANKGEDERKV